MMEKDASQIYMNPAISLSIPSL